MLKMKIIQNYRPFGSSTVFNAISYLFQYTDFFATPMLLSYLHSNNRLSQTEILDLRLFYEDYLPWFNLTKIGTIAMPVPGIFIKRG